jgi:hypothetical protein
MSLIALLLALAVLPLPTLAWNNPGHTLSAAIAYRVLRQANPQITCSYVVNLTECHMRIW